MSLDGFFAALDSLGRSLQDFCNVTPTSLCRLHTCEDRDILVADTAAMVSLIELAGSLRLTGSEEYEEVCQVLCSCLRTPLSREGHALQVVFCCDPERAHRDIVRAMAPLHVTARHLELDLERVLDDWEEDLSRYCASERTLLAFWTKPSILSRAEYTKALAENRRLRQPLAKSREAQGLHVAIARMRDVHRSQVRDLVDKLGSVRLRARVLEAHEAVAALRLLNAPKSTAPTWRPCLPGDPLPLRVPLPGSRRNEATSYLPPTIARQVWPCEARVHEGRLVEVDGFLYAPLYLSLPPQTLLPFASLFRSLLNEGLPWRASILLSGDGMKGQALKSVAASILSFASPVNRMLQQSFQSLQNLVLQGETTVGLQMSLVTWVNLDECESRVQARRTVSQRAARLASAVQSWGACDTSAQCGDALELYAATLPAMAPSQPVPKAIAPLSDAVRLLPLFRPCSPWTATEVPLRTSDGKFMPMSLFHSSMASWNEICFAGMGAGKSFFLNTLNFFFVLRPGQTRLPWLTVIDIGPSCAGVIELIRAALPRHKRHLAVFTRLRNVREAAINPFDTPLGCDAPLPNHAGFLVNLLALLCTPLNETAPADGVTDMLREALDAVYRKLAPQGARPRRFDPFLEPGLTRWLDEHHIRHDAVTTWWDIVAELFRAGNIPLAVQAQRHAVPLLTDVLVELNDPLIRDRFRTITLHGSAESVPEACVRHLTTALREYPILAAPTRFALGAAQIVGLDLSEVTPRGGAAAERQSGIMYLLARFVGAAHFFNSVADLDHVPPLYRPYHRPRFENLVADPKRLCYDEFHRASCADLNNPLSRQILADLTTASREARKQNLSIGLYSQQLGDFPSVLVDLATSIYVLGSGTAQEARDIAARFGLNQAALHALRHITRPTRAGAGLIALFRTSSGESIHYLTCTVGAYARWAFSTTAEDMRVRSRLYASLGCARALEVLRRAYPDGSIKDELERRREALEARPGEAPVDILEQIVAELEEQAAGIKREGA